jgi:hypothetical protein
MEMAPAGCCRRGPTSCGNLEKEIRHLVGAGSDDLHARTLQQALGSRSIRLCQRLADDLNVMATEGAAGR